MDRLYQVNLWHQCISAPGGLKVPVTLWKACVASGLSGFLIGLPKRRLDRYLTLLTLADVCRQCCGCGLAKISKSFNNPIRVHNCHASDHAILPNPIIIKGSDPHLHQDYKKCLNQLLVGRSSQESSRR